MCLCELRDTFPRVTKVPETLCRPLGPGERGEFLARGVRGIFRLPWTSPGLQGRGLPCRGPRVTGLQLLGA